LKVKPRARVEITAVLYDVFLEGCERGKDKKNDKEGKK
jgi:hypothetical protein